MYSCGTDKRLSKLNYSSGSGDALLAIINAGALISSHDKDGLTGKLLEGFIDIYISRQ